MPSDILIRNGERGLILGNTGSGKSQMLLAQIRYFPNSPVYILDTKEDEGIALFADEYDDMTETVTSLDDFNKIIRAKKQTWDFIRIIPNPMEMLSPELLDQYCQAIYDHKKPCLVAIDEVYQLHRSTGIVAGPGVISLLTRGRSKGITLLACSQRPFGLSRLFLTESQRFWIYRLQDKKDRQRIVEVMPYPVEKVLDKYEFWAYKSGETSGIFYSPIPIKHDPGYTVDNAKVSRFY